MLTFQKYVHFMRTQFPPGSRVLLLSDGTMGTLKEIDSAGRFLVNWDTGKRTALNLEDDHFRIFQSDPMELKLYFPLHGDLYTRNEWGDLAGRPGGISWLRPYPLPWGHPGGSPGEPAPRGAGARADALVQRIRCPILESEVCLLRCGTSRWAALGAWRIASSWNP